MTVQVHRSIHLFLIILLAGINLACSSNTDPDPTDKTYSISGTITPSGSEEVSGVTVSVGTASATTNATGAYTISGLEGGSYTVTPSKANHSFTPASLSVTITDADVSGQDFVITGVSAQPLRPDMVEIPPGTFMMGGTPGTVGAFAARPKHQVTLSKAFLIAETEVTQEQYQAVMGVNPSVYTVENGPVTSMSMASMAAYCNELSRVEGFALAYTISGESVTWNQSANGYRLPSEAEWEYAARAGDTSTINGGHNDGVSPNAEVDRVAWYLQNTTEPPLYDTKLARPQAVKQKQPNNWGLYDVLGNAGEIVWESWYEYQGEPETDPVYPNTGESYIMRGSSYADQGFRISLSEREKYESLPPTSIRHGFRVVRNK